MTCPKCKDTGKIPLKNKEDKIIPFAWQFCQCNPYPYGHEFLRQPQLDDFDFPMSEDWRAYTYHYCGVPDPAYKAPQKDEVPRERGELIISHRIIQDMALNALHKTLTRYIDEKLKEALKSKKVASKEKSTIDISNNK